ncbi:hypothetical protein OHA25_44490 [Nonomuraea sp. NBC_00507]|uniref:hypothetical protein n=1 Tax=Nonomuraea sp. NBC_00507 TaxID=2976002 RepID=UPI002E183C7E
MRWSSGAASAAGSAPAASFAGHAADAWGASAALAQAPAAPDGGGPAAVHRADTGRQPGRGSAASRLRV